MAVSGFLKNENAGVGKTLGVLKTFLKREGANSDPANAAFPAESD